MYMLFVVVWICNGNRTEWNPIRSVNKPDWRARKIKISEKRRRTKLGKKEKICFKRLTKETYTVHCFYGD